jgi:hypothetical protein
VRFDFKPELLQMLYDGAVNRPPQVGVLISDDAGLVSDAEVDVL